VNCELFSWVFLDLFPYNLERSWCLKVLDRIEDLRSSEKKLKGN